ncbi:glutamine amidotransferase, partial [Lecanoromycetidae sp. Uapishka_2]
IFTSITPAWNCINLSRLASKTTSALIFAHVRATTEGSLSDSNCHPFTHGSLMFMHNGNIACWRHVKRALALSVASKWFVGVQGNTDSEWAFALFLDSLERAGLDPDSPTYATSGFGHANLRKAMLQTIKRINEFVDATPSEFRNEMMDKRSLLNFAVADGHSVVCTKYVSSATDEAASLYFSSGTSWRQEEGGGGFKMERRDRGADIVLVASEPLTFERDNWVTVPTNSTITIHKQTVMIHPIIDEYYNHSPSYTRSSGFAVSKGLVSNAPGATQAASTSGKEEEQLREQLEKVKVVAEEIEPGE